MPLEKKWDTLNIPSKFDKITEWASKGVIQADIAKNLGVSYTLFKQWKKEHPDLSDCLKRANSIADEIVVSALHKRAVGYECEEVTEHVKEEGIGENKRTVKELKKVKKKYPPDTVACIYWTKNRMPAKWRDRREDLLTITSKEDLKKAEKEIDAIIGELEKEEMDNSVPQ
jgi:hypothetical protein